MSAWWLTAAEAERSLRARWSFPPSDRQGWQVTQGETRAWRRPRALSGGRASEAAPSFAADGGAGGGVPALRG